MTQSATSVSADPPDHPRCRVPRTRRADPFGAKLAERRIAAMLGACAGLPTEALESGALADALNAATEFAPQSRRLRVALKRLGLRIPVKSKPQLVEVE